MRPPHVIVIGAGSTGSAVAHDLTGRGLAVTVVERAGVAAGTTGHNQAQLHSGARYVVNDPESARECVQENAILRVIMPGLLELNDGLFVALTEEDLAFRPAFLAACADCGVAAREISPADALALEGGLNPRLLAAVRIPDGVFDPYRFCLSFLAAARRKGARVLTFTDVVGLDPSGPAVEIRSRRTGRVERLGADLVVNAAGPWADRVAALAGLRVGIEPSAGAMVTVDRRLCSMVINRLAPPADADIVVPQRETSILGTTSWRVSDPDDCAIPPGHVEQIVAGAEALLPAARAARIRGVMAAARPLILQPGAGGRAATRGFACFDHAAEGAPGVVSIAGGKTTTARLMAERLGDLACQRLGWQAECRTRTEVLESYRLGWAA